MIGLIELDHTLVENTSRIRRCAVEERGAAVEYRRWLVDMISGCCERVFLVTHADASDYEWVIESAKDKLPGFLDRAYFNDGRLGKVEPWEWHSRVLKRQLIPEFRTVETPVFVAFMWDVLTIDRVYRPAGIECVHIMPAAKKQTRAQEDRGRTLF